jgi:hypothetical protein
MLYLKLFENFDEELPYIKISTQDFLNESIDGLENEEVIKKITSYEYSDLLYKTIQNDKGMLGDKLKELLHKSLYKIFNHDKFKFQYSLTHINIYENKNTTISFYISLLEDDWFLVEFKPSTESYFFICDGFLGLKKLIKGEYEQYQKRIPRLYYEISKIAYDNPIKGLSIDFSEISVDKNSIGELEKLKNSLKVINNINVNRIDLYNYQIKLKGTTYFETFYSSEYNWWIVRYIKPNLSSLYYQCITVEGLIELIQDKIKSSLLWR